MIFLFKKIKFSPKTKQNEINAPTKYVNLVWAENYDGHITYLRKKKKEMIGIYIKELAPLKS